MTNKTTHSVPVLLLALLLSGCSLNPDYTRPAAPVAADWHAMPGYQIPATGSAAAEMHWHTFFSAPALQQVIEVALKNNKDLRQAVLSIQEARALYRVERADLLPNAALHGDGVYGRTPEDASSTGRAVKTELYEANVGLSSYEIDLFGKVRSNNQAALNEYLATQAAAAAVKNALIAEVANAYLQLLADQKLLALTEKTLEAQKDTYNLLTASLKNGISTEQDLARAETAVETARVNLYQYRRFVAQDRNALFVLLGVPQDDHLVPQTTLDDVVLTETLSPGLPAEVLLLRPDVQQAEYELLARHADIGAARAAFFPSITLTGSYGFASDGLRGLFSGGAANAWTFLPNITLPIFQGGRNKANLDLAHIRKEKAVLNYEATIQEAFRDVADQLAARATLEEQLTAQRRLVAAAQKVYDISDARYKGGIDSFLSVLDSQRALYTYQQAEIEIERQRLANLVNLYKALGGGRADAVSPFYLQKVL